jgi:MFS family permease
MIGSSFFIGCFVGSFILPRIADIKGRKPMFLLGLFLYIICVLGLLFSTSKPLMYMFLVVGGISETGRYYVAYVYAIEIMPKRL